MPFTKESAAKGGRSSKRGAGKTTLEIRDTFTSILSANLENVQLWIKQVALTDPAKAIDLIIKMASFIIPKPKPEQVNEDGELNLVSVAEVKEDYSKLTDEELEEQLHQANRVLHDNYCSQTRTFKPTK